jgi:UDP-3-O-[3-hydroxymyristoyl] glucosamine N-acyltransferase
VRLADLAERLGGVLIGDSEAVITGVAGIREASEGDLTFLASPRYAVYADQTKATAILVANGARGINKPVIQIDDPYAAFLEAAKLFRPVAEELRPGVHPTAVIGSGVRLGEGVSIGAQVVIESGAAVGDGTAIAALCYLGNGSRVGARGSIHAGVLIGERCILGDDVVVHAGTVIGSDGFGFAWNGQGHRKIPQVGAVVIEDDVEIGANCAIDRGTVGDTRVGRGSRLDNLVHVGHNVQVGEHSLLIAQVGIGGSTRIGKQVTLAGQVGIVGHVEIGDGTQIGAQAGVIHSVPPGSRVWGYPAMPLAQSKRVYASIKRTPQLLKQVRDLEQRLENLERSLGNGKPTSGGEAPTAERHGESEDD